MHKKMIQRVMNAPINLFFDVTPVGTIVNRFSNLDVLDYHFKGSCQHLAWCTIGILHVFVLILFANWKIIFIYPFVCYFIREILRLSQFLHLECTKIHQSTESG